MCLGWKYLWKSAGVSVSGVYRLLRVTVSLVDHSVWILNLLYKSTTCFFVCFFFLVGVKKSNFMLQLKLMILYFICGYFKLCFPQKQIKAIIMNIKKNAEFKEMDVYDYLYIIYTYMI